MFSSPLRHSLLKSCIPSSNPSSPALSETRMNEDILNIASRVSRNSGSISDNSVFSLSGINAMRKQLVNEKFLTPISAHTPKNEKRKSRSRVSEDDAASHRASPTFDSSISDNKHRNSESTEVHRQIQFSLPATECIDSSSAETQVNDPWVNHSSRLGLQLSQEYELVRPDTRPAPIHVEDLDDDDVEMWIIQAPSRMDMGELDGVKLRFKGTQTVSQYERSTNEESVRISYYPDSSLVGNLNLVLDSRESGERRMVSRAFTGKVVISENYTLPEPRYTSPPSPSFELPAGLKIRYKPFGCQNTPLVPQSMTTEDGVRTVSEQPRKRKSKHNIREVSDYCHKKVVDSSVGRVQCDNDKTMNGNQSIHTSSMKNYHDTPNCTQDGSSKKRKKSKKHKSREEQSDKDETMNDNTEDRSFLSSSIKTDLDTSSYIVDGSSKKRKKSKKHKSKEEQCDKDETMNDNTEDRSFLSSSIKTDLDTSSCLQDGSSKKRKKSKKHKSKEEQSDKDETMNDNTEDRSFLSSSIKTELDTSSYIVDGSSKKRKKSKKHKSNKEQSDNDETMNDNTDRSFLSSSIKTDLDTSSCLQGSSNKKWKKSRKHKSSEVIQGESLNPVIDDTTLDNTELSMNDSNITRIFDNEDALADIKKKRKKKKKKTTHE